MRVNFLCKGVLTVAMLCVALAALPAFATANQPGAGTLKAGKGAFASDASSLLQQVRNDAHRVRNDADQLEARLREPLLNDWESDGSLLERMRARVNAMDKLLLQLRMNHSKALPWQQQAIERIGPSVVNLTDTTEDAMATLKNNQEHIYASNLGGLADHMYEEAKVIDQAIGDLEKSTNAGHGG
ncbi:MAG: hypothetical protein ABSF46_15920 [Terriglobia bacterium]|jgi:hypothetical protein